MFSEVLNISNANERLDCWGEIVNNLLAWLSHHRFICENCDDVLWGVGGTQESNAIIIVPYHLSSGNQKPTPIIIYKLS